MLVEPEITHRLKTSWDKGHNMLASFFAQAQDLHEKLGHEKFAAWCFDELRISSNTLLKAAGLLRAVDAEMAKNSLGEASEAEKERKRLAAEEKARNLMKIKLGKAAEKFVIAIARTQVEWIQKSLSLAGALAEARLQMPSDKEFHDWINERESLTTINKNDRAALIKLGENPVLARDILASAKSRSYETIWRTHSVSEQSDTECSQHEQIQ